LTVLLVDDEEPMRRLAERALERRGWTVLAADCGEAALRLLGERHSALLPPPSIIVLDVAMPGIDGPALVRTVRETYPGLPAILLSGYTEQTLGRELPADEVAFLGKPYATKALVAEIERVAALGRFLGRSDDQAAS
jgi:two-component system cell cycle sensor histidine kinase/response regulator CckA